MIQVINIIFNNFLWQYVCLVAFQRISGVKCIAQKISVIILMYTKIVS